MNGRFDGGAAGTAGPLGGRQVCRFRGRKRHVMASAYSDWGDLLALRYAPL
jgi:hypothetical protein